jgi:hypothetical protein
LAKAQQGSVGEEHDGEQMFVWIDAVDQLLRFGVLLDIEPLVRDLVACQEAFGEVALGGPLRASHANAVVGDGNGSLPVAKQVV